MIMELVNRDEASSMPDPGCRKCRSAKVRWALIRLVASILGRTEL